MKKQIIKEENVNQNAVSKAIQEIFDWQPASGWIRELNFLYYMATQSPEWKDMERRDKANYLFVNSHINEFLIELQELQSEKREPEKVLKVA